MLASDGGALTADGVCALRTALVAAGFAFFPEITGRKQSSKEVGSWVGKCGTFDPAQVFETQYGPLLNTALYCKDLFAIDVDVDDPHWVSEIVAAMTDTLSAPLCVRHRGNSARLLALYRAPADALYTAVKGSDGMVEIFTSGDQKVTAFGLHTDKQTGQRTRLQWRGVPGNVQLSELPLVSLAQRDAFLEAVSDMLGDDAKRMSRSHHASGDTAQRADDIDELLRAFAHIPNDDAAWQAWNRAGMALHAACGGDPRGLELFAAWTLLNPDTRHRDCAARWANYNNSPVARLGAGTIFWRAKQHGYVYDAAAAAQKRRDTRLQRFIAQRQPQ